MSYYGRVIHLFFDETGNSFEELLKNLQNRLNSGYYSPKGQNREKLLDDIEQVKNLISQGKKGFCKSFQIIGHSHLYNYHIVNRKKYYDWAILSCITW